MMYDIEDARSFYEDLHDDSDYPYGTTTDLDAWVTALERESRNIAAHEAYEALWGWHNDQYARQQTRNQHYSYFAQFSGEAN